MKEQKRDGSVERQILIAMISNTSFLSRIAGKWDNSYLRSKWSRLVGSWCVKHFQKYGRAPKRQIEFIFREWCQRDRDDDTIKLVDRFLTSISEEFTNQKAVDIPALLDNAERHFNHLRVEVLKDTLETDLESGDIEKAVTRLETYTRINVVGNTYTDVLRDEDALERAFLKQAETIIRYPEHINTFVGPTMSRGRFVAFEAIDKRGKSWNLLDAAWRGLCQRKRVLYLECGDMTESEVLIRFMVRAAQWPSRKGEVLYPKKIVQDDEDVFVKFDKRHYPKPLDRRRAREGFERVLKFKWKSKGTFFRMACFPAYTKTASDIDADVAMFIRDNWKPDIVICDYADILAPINPKKDEINQIDETWGRLRAIPQKYDCLLITATQANTLAYSTNTLSRKNFSRNKMKNAHASGIIGINQSEEEMKNEIVRWNWIVNREFHAPDNKCCFIARCLALANPCVRAAPFSWSSSK